MKFKKKLRFLFKVGDFIEESGELIQQELFHPLPKYSIIKYMSLLLKAAKGTIKENILSEKILQINHSDASGIS